MHNLILACVLLTQSYGASTPDIYVAVEEGRESRMIQSWQQPFVVNPHVKLNKEDEDYHQKIEAIRSRVIQKTVVVAWDDFESRKQHDVGTFHYPHYRIGRYGTWHRFPDRAFIHPVICMQYVDYLLLSWDMDDQILKWQHQHDEFERQNINNFCYRNGYLAFWQYHRQQPQIVQLNYNDTGRWIDIPHKSVPVVAHRPHPQQLIRNPLER